MEIHFVSVVALGAANLATPASWVWKKGDDPAILGRAVEGLQQCVQELQDAAAVAMSATKPLETGE